MEMKRVKCERELQYLVSHWGYGDIINDAMKMVMMMMISNMYHLLSRCHSLCSAFMCTITMNL